jgi:hypothetical protein
MDPVLTPAAEKLLREIARRDNGHGVVFKWMSRGRYNLVGTTYTVNQRTFYPLTGAGLVTEDHDDAPVYITDAGRKLVAELEAKPKSPRAQPRADSPAALQLLREIAASDQPILVHSGTRRGIWSLGAHDGYSARATTFVVLQKDGLIDIEYLFAGGKRVTVTDAGAKRLALR